MDIANQFETPTTFKLHRGEYLLGLAASLGLFIYHIHDVRWVPAVILFVYIDLIGYIPGAIAFRRNKDHVVPKGYYYAYNTMHSLITQGVVAGLWMLLYKPEWALLVLPLHLFADRGVFGNFLKPLSLPFEPVPNQAFATFIQNLVGSKKTAEVTATPELAGR